MSDYRNLKLRREDAVAHLRLSRPEVHNALDDSLVEELTRAAAEIAADPSVRVAVLSGEGASFCAGADIGWMKRMVGYTTEENLDDSRRLAAMFRSLDRMPCPLVGRVHGVALGAGSGLVSVCDVVVASRDTLFGFSEVRLGILPAIISPFVLRRLSHGAGRALFLTGERFGADRAGSLGFVDRVVEPDALDAQVEEVVGHLLRGGPRAQAAIKDLIPEVHGRRPEEVGEITARANARARTGEEGQEGLGAFLEKRRPSWAPKKR